MFLRFHKWPSFNRTEIAVISKIASHQTQYRCRYRRLLLKFLFAYVKPYVQSIDLDQRFFNFLLFYAFLTQETFLKLKNTQLP